MRQQLGHTWITAATVVDSVSITVGATVAEGSRSDDVVSDGDCVVVAELLVVGRTVDNRVVDN